MKKMYYNALFASLLLAGCGNQTASSVDTSDPQLKTINFGTEPGDGEEAYICNETIQEFYDNYSKGYSLKYQGNGDIFASDGLTLRWSTYAKAHHYGIQLSVKESGDYELKFDNVSKNEICIPDLLINQSYRWQILSYNELGELIADSPEYTFTTVGTPRTISIEGVSNSRDIGGYITASGKRVKQNMVFRSAKLDGITDEGIEKATNYYGIKTDLDLRNPATDTGMNAFASPLGDDINYINIPGCYWTGGSNGCDVSANFANMAKEMRVFTKEENFPMVIHCSIGQDRTGSLCLLLGALLGVNGKDLSMDYEMSSFSSAAGGADIKVTDKFTYQYNPLFNYFNSFADEDLMLSAEKYCIEKLGLTEEEIASIRNNLLEK